ncbi:MAG: hypothetical protein EA381_18125 [Planctomycetaceae bacterium]|nr:MAG: hypothetical protein EA381_18125 [Planctomycetaceae bacterium]
MTQTTLAILIVALAALWLAKQAYTRLRSLFGDASSAAGCGGCTGCAGGSLPDDSAPRNSAPRNVVLINRPPKTDLSRCSDARPERSARG